MPPVKYSGNIIHNIEAVSTRSDIQTDRGVKMSEMKEWPHLVGKVSTLIYNYETLIIKNSY